jgi:hypothetical protein
MSGNLWLEAVKSVRIKILFHFECNRRDPILEAEFHTFQQEQK